MPSGFLEPVGGRVPSGLLEPPEGRVPSGFRVPEGEPEVGLLVEGRRSKGCRVVGFCCPLLLPVGGRSAGRLLIGFRVCDPDVTGFRVVGRCVDGRCVEEDEPCVRLPVCGGLAV